MTLFPSLLFASLAFAESESLALQICLDRAGYSCNTIDGQWGRKSERALARYVADRTDATNAPPRALSPNAALDRYFADAADLFRIETVTEADLAALACLPESPAEKAELPYLGYSSIKEMFAERGHLSQAALERINPGVDWEHPQPGLKLVIPDFPTLDESLAAHPHPAAQVRISLSACEITALDANGRTLAFFPCSIAASRSKRPPPGELRLSDVIAWPNYTYTPDYTPPGQRVRRYMLAEGPNSPIGVAWLGLSLTDAATHQTKRLVGYGIHGTPTPETVGRAESHGCFRLANWNAARLLALCRDGGTPVFIDP